MYVQNLDIKNIFGKFRELLTFCFRENSYGTVNPQMTDKSDKPKHLLCYLKTFSQSFYS